MGKVYVVSEGEYSDFRVVAIFDDKDRAGLFKAAIKSENDISEYELNEPSFAPGYESFIVEMSENGNVVRVERFGGIADGVFDFYRRDPRIGIVNCWARDAEHAVKIANEKRAMLIAENRWGWQEKKD